MQTKIIEATNGPRNWGKFMLGRMTSEWHRRPTIPLSEEDAALRRMALIYQLGWRPGHLWVFDLQTGEGALFSPGGYAKADLEKHRIWVCPLFEPFLTWLYTQDLRDIDALPDHIDLPDAPFELSGYRRSGPAEAE